jgi:hypothetical protein
MDKTLQIKANEADKKDSVINSIAKVDESPEPVETLE